MDNGLGVQSSQQRDERPADPIASIFGSAIRGVLSVGESMAFGIGQQLLFGNAEQRADEAHRPASCVLGQGPRPRHPAEACRPTPPNQIEEDGLALIPLMMGDGDDAGPVTFGDMGKKGVPQLAGPILEILSPVAGRQSPVTAPSLHTARPAELFGQGADEGLVVIRRATAPTIIDMRDHEPHVPSWGDGRKAMT